MEAAFFDLDKTVIAKASMVAFGRDFYRAGMISRRTVMRAVYGHLVYQHMGASEEKLAEVREKALRMTTGWEQDRVRQIVRDALEEVVEPIIYAEALDLIAEHKEAGRVVALVSASPEEIVEPLGEFLGVDRTLATRAKVDDDGRYTGEVDFYCAGPFKPVAMAAMAEEMGIDLRASYAYSDSATDAPMLEAVGHPVAVNPDRVLARVGVRAGMGDSQLHASRATARPCAGASRETHRRRRRHCGCGRRGLARLPGARRRAEEVLEDRRALEQTVRY